MRSQVETRGIRATYDYCERGQRTVCQVIFRQESAETSKLTNVSQLHAKYIKQYCSLAFGDGQHLVRWNKEKFRRLIDEPLDEPGAGNAVNFRALARNPFHPIAPRNPSSAVFPVRISVGA